MESGKIYGTVKQKKKKEKKRERKEGKEKKLRGKVNRQIRYTIPDTLAH